MFIAQTIRAAGGFINKTTRKVIVNNLIDLLAVFGPVKLPETQQPGAKQILIYNWRDMTHKWAGGSELYIHEMAKVLIAQGNTVTLFCGNDGTQKRTEVIDGVTIIRRGGFYTVYVWAILYYLVQFRGQFDVVIDTENGIPFFTPLYSRATKFLLIHHIHQDVFWKELSPFKAVFASFLEKRCMPFIYRNPHVITVSESSRAEIRKRFKENVSAIDVVHPGVVINSEVQANKTKQPLVLYLGRLKPYKNVDVAIKAFATVVTFYPKAKMVVAGSGESLPKLRRLAKGLGVSKSVTFVGQVSDKKKTQLYAKSWVMLQPSMVEGWGITVIEANSFGTPVIASNVNGLKDSITHNKTGVLVKKANVEEFIAASMNVLANESLRQKLSANALKWSKRFSWQKSGQAFSAIIDARFATNKNISAIPRFSVATE